MPIYQRNSVKLSKSNLTIETLLSFMESEQVVSISLNHMVIEGALENIPDTLQDFDTFPSFTVSYDGFVEVELIMNQFHTDVIRLSLRQAAMTFEELDEGEDVLPSLTIAADALQPDELERLNVLALDFVKRGRLKDKSRAEALITQYADRVIFNPRKYGRTSHVQ